MISINFISSLCLLIGIAALPVFCEEELISLESEKGKELLLGTEIKNQRMIDLHQKQKNLKYCGPASLADLCNGINVSYRVKLQNGDITEKALQELLDNEIPIQVNERDILKYLHSEKWDKELKLNKQGVTLLELRDGAGVLQLGTGTVFTYDKKFTPKKVVASMLETIKDDNNIDSINDINEFRDQAKKSIATKFLSEYLSFKGIIVNFDMAALGYKQKMGHFSPLGGYNKDEDKFLLLDVWPDHPSVWVSTELLWKAMTVKYDNDSNLPRGYLNAYELMV